ncbi:MAG: sulfocyanin-like copper-binding protein [Candidatus Limnocylindria bacterium]
MSVVAPYVGLVKVSCPQVGEDVDVERCLRCAHLKSFDRNARPPQVVCTPATTLNWLGRGFHALRWWWLVFLIGGAYLTFVVAGSMVATSLVRGSSMQMGGSSMQMGGSPGAAPIAQAPAVFTADQIPVALTNFQVAVPAVISAGVKTLQITNAASIQHELLVFHPDASIDPNHLPLGSDGNVNEDAPGVNKISDGDNIDPAKSQTRQIDLSQPGIYVFVCNLPGHYGMGMWTTVTVK